MSDAIERPSVESGGARLRRTVALVGLMGAGKSAVGRRLAQALGVTFLDADDEIERAADMTIPEIFERFGEAHFREGERRVIARLIAGPPIVLATGGGAYVDAGTRAALRDAAHTIWIKADLDTLVERCGRRDDRPLLVGRDVRETLGRLLREREPFYSQADSVVVSSTSPCSIVVKAAIADLSAAGVIDGTEKSGETG